ncbi:hypothetical protein P4631_09255 [Halalkalibacterium halodurans]|uniref:hypothetical protein n=1 Tax=Halalkalibacterium halodurans TaxID=86665 RepID=UPI002E20DC7A|nr:hypothetical protein [Halalkalibacterium halodurans]
MSDNNTIQKPTLPQSTAEALTSYLDIYSLDDLIVDLGRRDEGLFLSYPQFSAVDKVTLILAAAFGWVTEKSPEEKLREYYEGACELAYPEDYFDGVADGVRTTLRLLGIKISGINAEEAE